MASKVLTLDHYKISNSGALHKRSFYCKCISFVTESLLRFHYVAIQDKISSDEFVGCFRSLAFLKLILISEYVLFSYLIKYKW